MLCSQPHSHPCLFYQVPSLLAVKLALQGQMHYKHYRRRGAGEMKGVTMEQNKKQLAALRVLLEQPGNRACADCTGGGAAGRATWASINTGVFICMRCAGHHRGLGVHISKVVAFSCILGIPFSLSQLTLGPSARGD